jgi:hypothetical protein
MAGTTADSENEQASPPITQFCESDCHRIDQRRIDGQGELRGDTKIPGTVTIG